MSSQVSAVLPSPLCKPTRHPLRWTKQKVEALVDGAIGAHIGTLMVVASYYLLFEVYHPFTVGWHELVSDNGLRHMFRGVGEGLLGGSLGQILVFNSFKHRKHRKLNVLDKIEFRLRIPNIKDQRRLEGWQFALAPVYVILYALPGFWVAWFALKGIHHSLDGSHSQVIHSYWQRIETVWTSEKDQKLVGLFASLFLGRRPLKKIANDIQLWFIERRLAKGKPVRWYHPPTFEARYNEVKDGAVKPSAVGQQGWVAGLMGLSVFFALCLAGFGYYVLTEIAA